MDVDLKSLKKLVTKANQRITRIENKYGDNAGLGSWSVRNLYDALDNSVVNGISQLSGKIKIDKSMTKSQLKAVEKATQRFLSSKTSTLKGIDSAKKLVRQGIQKTLADPNPKVHRNVTDKDAEILYSFLEDKTLRGTTEKIGASTLWNFLIDAKEKKESGDQFGFKDFMQDVKNHSEVIPDKSMREDLETIYNRYFT